MDNAQGAGAPSVPTAAVRVFGEIIPRLADGLPADGAAIVDEPQENLAYIARTVT